VDFIAAIENSAYATWVRESPSIFAYTTVLSLHAIGLAIVVGLNTVLALRLLGFPAEIPLAPMRKLFPWMYAGFTINALSGLSLLAANFSNDITNWMFLLKLALIALAMINLEMTRSRVFDAPEGLAEAASSHRARIFAVGALVLWSAAIVAGRLTEYPGMVASWFA